MSRQSHKFPIEVSRYWDLVPEGGWLIYALTDPTKDNAIRYVGYTGCRKYNRLWFHLNNAQIKRSSRRSKWIYGLLKRELIPGFEILEKGTGDWEDRERHWIRTLREQGADLVNASDGGKGPVGCVQSRKSLAEKRSKYFINHCAIFIGTKREPCRSEIKACEQCGKSFFSRLKRETPIGRCCSRVCAKLLLMAVGKKNTIRADELSILMGGRRHRAQKCICPYCKSEFLADCGKVKRAANGPYCSLRCSGKHHWWLGLMTPKEKGRAATA